MRVPEFIPAFFARFRRSRAKLDAPQADCDPNSNVLPTTLQPRSVTITITQCSSPFSLPQASQDSVPRARQFQDTPGTVGPLLPTENWTQAEGRLFIAAVQQVLLEQHGNITRTARRLGITAHGLRKRAQACGFDIRAYRSDILASCATTPQPESANYGEASSLTRADSATQPQHGSAKLIDSGSLPELFESPSSETHTQTAAKGPAQLNKEPKQNSRFNRQPSSTFEPLLPGETFARAQQRSDAAIILRALSDAGGDITIAAKRLRVTPGIITMKALTSGVQVFAPAGGSTPLTSTSHDARESESPVRATSADQATMESQRQFVLTSLKLPEFQSMSNREAARRLGVSHEFIRTLRIEHASERPDIEVTRRGVKYKMNTSAIGRRRKPETSLPGPSAEQR
ncbi:MAG TPA: helix-turn-helix domain-containing protein [Blastocatellia bacterium]|nr:helix-turn-helix domain-containing protein [Blastocatellia bacterium]